MTSKEKTEYMERLEATERMGKAATALKSLEEWQSYVLDRFHLKGPKRSDGVPETSPLAALKHILSDEDYRTAEIIYASAIGQATQDVRTHLIEISGIYYEEEQDGIQG